jgi:hypothetical protein
VPDATTIELGSERSRLVGVSVVGHHPVDHDSQSVVELQRPLQERDGRCRLLIGQLLDEGQARVVVDGHVDDRPAEARVTALLRPIKAPSGARAHPADLLGVQMQEITRMRPLVAVGFGTRL